MTTRIAAVATALPPHRYPQAELTEAFAGIVAPGGQGRAVLERFHAATGVRTRHLALPVEDYAGLDGFRAANDAYIRVGTDLGEQAVRCALARAGLDAKDVDHIVTVSITASPRPAWTPGWFPGSACAPTSSACRFSGWAASPGQRASPGCTTSSAATPTASPCCSRSSCAR